MRFLNPIKLLLGISILSVSIGVSGCASKGPLPTYTGAELAPLSSSGETSAPDCWWTAFGDAGLDRAVQLAVGENFDLSAALESLRAARALTQREASDLFGDLNGVINSPNSFGPGPSNTRLTWGLNASYQVDLWGQIRSRVEAERFRSVATHWDYHTVALSLSAEIAETWFTLIAAHAQLELLEEQVKTNRKGLKAVELRFAVAGEGGSPNVLRQRQLVQSTLEQIIVVNSNIEVLEHRLAVLTGQPPQTATYSTGSTFPELPPIPYTGLPSELISRRPDVQANLMALAAADQDLAAAVTDQYPRLDLSASLVNSADRPESIFRDWFFSIGGQLVAPILDGRQRRSEVERRKALVCQRFSEYRQSILIALQEVEDGLALERYQVQRIEKITTQVELAKKASDQLLQFFITGEASYLDVLSANQSQQSLQRSLLTARLDLIRIRVGLYLALAGDFDTREVAACRTSEVSEIPYEVLTPEQDAGLIKNEFPSDEVSADTVSDASKDILEPPAPSESRISIEQLEKEID